MSKFTKNGLFCLMLAVFGLSVSVFPALAKDAKNNLENIPQKNGTYDIPNHPNMKVRVFVHYPKMFGKPAPAPVCTNDDPDSLSLVHAGYAHLPQTINYVLNVSSVPSSVKGSNLPAIALNSVKVWTNAISDKVKITQNGTTSISKANSDDGINVIAWGVTPSNALAVTYAMYYTSGPLDGTIVGVDTIMNGKVPWSWSGPTGNCNPKAYDAQNILTHELGHWMGLKDEYDSASYQNATMYGYGSLGEIKKDTLTTGDVDGARAIYSIL
jgi:hypothetical protein